MNKQNAKTWAERLITPWSVDLPNGYPELSPDEARMRREKGERALQEIRQAFDSGIDRITLEPGEYLFSGELGRHPILDGLRNLEIVANGVTFWFEPPMVHGLFFRSCENVTVHGLTLDFSVPCWYQAQVVSIDKPDKAVFAELVPGYAPVNFKGEPESSGERAIMFYRKDGEFINHRHTPSRWKLLEDGKTLHCLLDRFGIPDDLEAGDYLVGSLRMGMALGSVGCANMKFEGVNIFSSPGCALWEGGSFSGLPEHLSDYKPECGNEFPEISTTGANLYDKVRATRKPGTNRLHAFGADIFHMAGSDRGPVIDACELAYGSDDTLNIHGNFGRVIHKTNKTHVHLQGEYVAGDMLEFWEGSSLELLGEARVVHVEKVADGPSERINDSYSATTDYLVELDREIDLCPLALVVMDGKQGNEGFVVRNCWFHDDFQRTLINGSPGGLIENNIFENLGYGICVQFETWGPWMEGPFARDLVIRCNQFIRCAPEENVIAVQMFPASTDTLWEATPVKNLTVERNCIDAFSGFPLKISNVEDLIIRRNLIHANAHRISATRPDWQELRDPSCAWSNGSVSPARSWIDLENCRSVSVYGNTFTTDHSDGALNNKCS